MEAFVSRSCQEVTIYFDLSVSYIRLRTKAVRDTAVYNPYETQILLLNEPLPEEIKSYKKIDVDGEVFAKIVEIATQIYRLSKDFAAIQDDAIRILA